MTSINLPGRGDYLPREAAEDAHRFAREHSPRRSRDLPKHPLRLKARATVPAGGEQGHGGPITRLTP